jgi:hypothetical protein
MSGRGLSLALLAGMFVLAGCGGARTTTHPALAPSQARLGAVASPSRALTDRARDPRDLDLNDLVPARGRVDAVWYVPAGRTLPEVVVGWSYRGPHAPSLTSDRLFALTAWHPDQLTAGSARWTPHTLFRDSPFPFDSSSVRTADVTGDGHQDLLVTIRCNVCNHGTAAASIFADRGDTVRRVYGNGFLDGSKSEHVGVRGRVITETAWGATSGLVWFDEPRGGSSVCCPDHRLQTFLRWQGGEWVTVMRRNQSPGDDPFLRSLPAGTAPRRPTLILSTDSGGVGTRVSVMGLNCSRPVAERDTLAWHDHYSWLHDIEKRPPLGLWRRISLARTSATTVRAVFTVRRSDHAGRGLLDLLCGGDRNATTTFAVTR